jgi:ABC-type transport system substrate-binding protein
MDNDQLDFDNSPLTKEWVDRWQADPRFRLKSYSDETSFFILDINKYGGALLPGGSPNPALDPEMGINVMTILSFRQALACLVNRSYIVNVITEGFGLPIWTPVPTYMTTYVHPDIKPDGALANLTYGKMDGDVARAEAYLVADHFLYNLTEYPWRFYDKNLNGHHDAGEEFMIIFYVRSDSLHRSEFADDYVIKLTSDPIKIQVDYRPRERAECSNKVFGAKEFHMYTGGWVSIGPDPDYLYDLYHSTMYWHPGRPPNYGDGYDGGWPEGLDKYAEDLKFATSVPAAQEAAYNFQERFAELAWNVPLWCASGVKAYRRIPVEEPGPMEWKGVVNQAGLGVNSRWTFLNLMKECEYYPPIDVTYGFSASTIDWLNPFYAEWYLDWEILNKIYDSCAARNPYDLGVWVQQLAEKWEVGQWIDDNTQQRKTKVRVTLRSDLYWQDGTPITIADLAYTFYESIDTLRWNSLIPPSWYAAAQYIRDVYVLDALNVDILWDLYMGAGTLWVVRWALETPVIPKHIWKPIIDASTPQNNVVHTFQPDPNCIGSGPFRFAEYEPEDHLLSVANTPGSVVHGVTSPGYWQYCPIHLNVAATDYKVKLDPGFPNKVMNVTFEVKTYNFWLNQCSNGILDGTKYVYVDNLLYSEEYVPKLRSGYPGYLEPKFVFENMTDFNRSDPVGSMWHEVYPMSSWEWNLTSGVDSNLNGTVDYCDYLNFTDSFGNKMEAHVSAADPFHLELDYVEIYHYETFTIPLTKLKHEIKIAFHIESPSMLDMYHSNPWICQWINATLPIWITIKQDVGGAKYQDVVHAPDGKVDGKEIAFAASAFNTWPGAKRWNSLADVASRFYRVDGKDIADFAKYYDKW